MLRTVALLALLPGLAAAQPISFQLTNNVKAGQKPTLKVTAIERIVALELDLTRKEDGGKVTGKAGVLKPGQSFVFSIGDGAAGQFHYAGKIMAQVSGQDPWEYALTFETVVKSDLKVTYAREHLDLEKKLLEFQMSSPAKSAEITVIGEDGQELGAAEVQYKGEAPGTWLPIRWGQRPGNVMKLQLRAVATNGFASNVTLTPWSVSIPHEDVNFVSGSAVIDAGERPKLDEAFAKISAAATRAAPFVRCLLFIGGHTDTVGTREHNHKLSVDRARSIALYFKQKGLKIPISYEGFGEDLLRVKTPDETDERANRRADYVLAAEEPLAKGGKADWKSVP